MRVLQVHNQYRFFGGEDAVVENTAKLMERRGVQISSVIRSSCDVGSGLWSRVSASLSSVHSRSSYLSMENILRELEPSVVHIHNLYPLLSPSVLLACSRASVPVVMTLHNFRLICPIGIFFRQGKVCEACVGGREYSCVLNNCRNSLAESTAYAVRTVVARRFRQFVKGVNAFVAPAQFLVRKYVDAGFDEQKFTVIPNFTPLPTREANPHSGKFAAFIGRFSPEKGVDILADAISRIPEMVLSLAGDWSAMPETVGRLPRNASLMGNLGGAELEAFFRGARFIVVPSVCYEVCPMVVLESMSFGLPVIASNIGGLPELVEDGQTGLLFEPGNAADLSDKMRRLWNDPSLCERLGKAARKKVKKVYSEHAFFEGLRSVYSELTR